MLQPRRLIEQPRMSSTAETVWPDRRFHVCSGQGAVGGLGTENDNVMDGGKYAISLVCNGAEEARSRDWAASGLVPERIRIVRAGVTVGVVAAESGHGYFDSDALGRFQVRYAWIEDEEVASYAPGDFWRGYRERGGLPDTLALYREDEEGRYMFVHEEVLGWPPPFRRRGWPERANVSLATLVEYMDGEIDTLPLGPSPRRAGMRDVAR